ncbi:DUF11 domain-containing protein [Sphingomonas sp. 8AM]|uniref:DUF11 domain-containing protein n=1 Tax=Sphingomonas sp. 8AM TaxID=2653170 RepID=UPI0012F3C1F7|nr:DUF11 domain-containing protein [Sphingomonas sp. 8AM]VXC33208.1 conserved exported hypothetical protein [Sphingomonas sp. 8AM]
MTIRPLLLLAALAAASPALAAGPLQVASKVMVEARQRAADGTTRIALVPAHRVVPGDRVVFTLAYRNTGAQPLADLVFDNPVPSGVAYRAPAPNSPAPELSVDGRRYGTLAQLGAVEPDAVTHVRWRLARPLAPGASGTFAFQAVLK